MERWNFTIFWNARPSSRALQQDEGAGIQDLGEEGSGEVGSGASHWSVKSARWLGRGDWLVY